MPYSENVFGENMDMTLPTPHFSTVLDLDEMQYGGFKQNGEGIYIKVDETFAGGSHGISVVIGNDDAPDGGYPTVVYSHGQVVQSELVAGYEWAIGTLQPITKRYLRIYFDQGSAYSSGKITAGITFADHQVSTKLSFDTDGVAKEASFEDRLDTVSFNTWGYLAGQVTAPERTTSAVVVFEEALKGHNDRANWIEFIRTHYAPAQWPRSKYQIDLEKNTFEVVCTIKIAGAEISRDVWDSNTDNITFGPRVAVDWAWADFISWFKLNQQFMNAIETFDKEQ